MAHDQTDHVRLISQKEDSRDAKTSTIALADDAEVVSGLGSVPLGRWHDPGRDGWSGRCRPTGKARSESRSKE